jgi:hypothetical protein
MNDGPVPKESIYGSNAESIVGGGRKKKARKTMNKTMNKKGGENKMPNLFGAELNGGEYMKKNGHGGAHRKGHVSRRRKSSGRKTARRR